ncbi:helix-turn-helix domain-containing protein [Streptomyces sp. NPDC001652]|uniref:helix-turn-helix domain-containing protein n=1 Tax=Streptomyces sp. NPDC001652 TaxID=3154393 RepID=UPI00332B7524
MGESVLSRAVRILEVFTPEEPALTVSEISRRTGLHLATASRLVAELVTHGFLARDTDRRVRAGMRLWELGTRASPTLSLRDTAMPFLEGVHDVVGHHVQPRWTGSPRSAPRPRAADATSGCREGRPSWPKSPVPGAR